jgi:predicted 3-demethylubiquinone-9 3-methyltransferase (glyoxalase superfamily)
MSGESMNKITPFLWYDNNCEEAMNFYVSIFKDSKVLNVARQGEGGPVTSVNFVLNNQEFTAFNAGPQFKFNEAISFFVECENQAEVDYYWERLTADGGEESQCGWLKDKYGLSWQIIPKLLGQLFGDPDREKAGRAVQAMFQMHKLDCAALQRAFDGK